MKSSDLLEPSTHPPDLRQRHHRAFPKFLPTLASLQECQYNTTGGDAFLLKGMLSSMEKPESSIERLLPPGTAQTGRQAERLETVFDRKS